MRSGWLRSLAIEHSSLYVDMFCLQNTKCSNCCTIWLKLQKNCCLLLSIYWKNLQNTHNWVTSNVLKLTEEDSQWQWFCDSTPWVKKTRHLTLAYNFTKYWPIFTNSFTVRLSRKFVTKSYTNTPPHPKRVATLPCEISVFKNRHS